eukprot:scaffold2392_cov287-Chaetoceros_neogracile.AAC.11
MSIVPTWHGVYVLHSYDFAAVFSRMQYIKCLLVTCGPMGPEGGQSLYKNKALNMIKGKHMGEAQVVIHGVLLLDCCADDPDKHDNPGGCESTI